MRLLIPRLLAALRRWLAYRAPYLDIDALDAELVEYEKRGGVW